MKTNTVRSVQNNGGKIAVRFFDNEGQVKQKTLDLDYTKANANKVRREIVPAFEKALRDKANISKQIPLHLSYYANKYIEQIRANRHTKLVAHTGRMKAILAYLGENTDVNTITELQIEEFFMQLTCKRATKLDWLVVLRGILDKARKGKALEKNIADDFKLPLERNDGDDSAIEPFSPDEVTRLLAHSKGTFLHNYLGIAFFIGARPEEIIALQIKDIDLTAGIVHIESAITKGQLKMPKTKASKRSVPLPDHAMKYFTQQIAEAKAKNSVYLFSNSKGEHLRDIEDLRGKKSRSGAWYQLLEKAQVPHKKLMQTRHTFAVQAIKSNAFVPQDIANILGHTSLNMLLSHYGKFLGKSHLNVNRSVDIFSDMGDVLGDLQKDDGVKSVA